MSQIIDVQQAEINTVAVEIKTLTLGRKQMTRSVFRQLPTDRLFSYSQPRLAGTVWGWVNYYWGDLRPQDWLQVVWEKDRRLYRSAVSKQDAVSVDRYRAWREDVDDVLIYAILNGIPVNLHDDTGNYSSIDTMDLRPDQRFQLGATVQGVDVYSMPNLAAQTLLLKREAEMEQEDGEIADSYTMQGSREARAHLRRRWKKSYSYQQYEATRNRILSDGRPRIATYRDSYLECLNSPQLFIAV